MKITGTHLGILVIALYFGAQTCNANEITISQIGDDFTLTVVQKGENHTITGLPVYGAQGINGDRNTLTINQDGEEYHHVEGEVVGNDNVGDIYQGGGGKSNFAGAQVHGDDNTLKVWQGKLEDGTIDTTEAGDHTSYSVIMGDNNNMEVYQRDHATNCCNSAHFVSNVIVGDNNHTKTLQRGNGGHYLDTYTFGNDNSIDVLQRGSQGSHYGDIDLYGDDHTVNTQQKDQGAHSITLDLTNSGGAYSVNTLQEGATNQTYSLVGSCTNANGCAVTVSQN